MTDVKILTLDEILSIGVEERVVTIPHWKGAVKIRALPADEAREAYAACMKTNANGELELDNKVWQDELLVRCTVEPKITSEALPQLWKQQYEGVFALLNAIQGMIGTPKFEVSARASFRPGTAGPK